MRNCDGVIHPFTVIALGRFSPYQSHLVLHLLHQNELAYANSSQPFEAWDHQLYNMLIKIVAFFILFEALDF